MEKNMEYYIEYYIMISDNNNTKTKYTLYTIYFTFK